MVDLASIVDKVPTATSSETPPPEGEEAPGGNMFESGLTGLMQTLSFGFADEAKAGVRSMFGDTTYDQELQAERDRMGGMKEEHDTAYGGGGLIGAILPALATGGASAAVSLPMAAARAAAVGGAQAAAQGFGEGEGGVGNRIENAAKDGLMGVALGGVLGAGARAIQKPGKAAAAAATAPKRPNSSFFKSTEKAAYQAVKDSKITFDHAAKSNLSQDMWQRVNDGMFDPSLSDADKQIANIIRKFDKTLKPVGKSLPPPLELGRLENYRKTLKKAYNTTKDPRLIELQSAVDDAINANPSAAALTGAARAATRQFHKVKTLEDLVSKVENQTSATYSGTNLNNKYRQAFEKVIDNPKLAAKFDPTELKAMENLVKQPTLLADGVRKLGRLSPMNGGLMSLLTIGLSHLTPLTLAGGAAGEVARQVGDKTTKNLAEGIRNQVAGFTPPSTPISTQPNLLARAAPQMAATMTEPPAAEPTASDPDIFNQFLMQRMMNGG